MTRLLIFVIGFVGSFSSLQAQNKEVSKYIQQLYNTWDSTYSNYGVSHDDGDSITAINLIKSLPIQVQESNTALTPEALEQQVLLQESKVIDGDIGLNMRGDYVYNLDPGIGFEDNLFLHSKI